jgi:hypothetical protein
MLARVVVWNWGSRRKRGAPPAALPPGGDGRGEAGPLYIVVLLVVSLA